jgi:hypothetical protein
MGAEVDTELIDKERQRYSKLEHILEDSITAPAPINTGTTTGARAAASMIKAVSGAKAMPTATETVSDKTRRKIFGYDDEGSVQVVNPDAQSVTAPVVEKQDPKGEPAAEPELIIEDLYSEVVESQYVTALAELELETSVPEPTFVAQSNARSPARPEPPPLRVEMGYAEAALCYHARKFAKQPIPVVKSNPVETNSTIVRRMDYPVRQVASAPVSSTITVLRECPTLADHQLTDKLAMAVLQNKHTLRETPNSPSKLSAFVRQLARPRDSISLVQDQELSGWRCAREYEQRVESHIVPLMRVKHTQLSSIMARHPGATRMQR